MPQQIEIANIALQKLGAPPITSLGQSSKSAVEANRCYDHCRRAELEEHPWRFAIKLASLAADADEPIFGKSASYTLPSDYLRLINQYPELNFNDNDFEIQGNKIYTNEDAPLEIRYVKDVTSASEFSNLFAEMLACRMALQMCEVLTQSNSKKQVIASEYAAMLAKAKKGNAFLTRPAEAVEDTWISVRT